MSAVILLLIIYAISIPFYLHFEPKWGLVTTIYFITTTICTVGYGDVYPTSDISRIFTMLLMFAGVSVFFYHVTHFGKFTERTIDPHVQRRLEILRNLTALQTGDIKQEQVKKIKEKISR